MLQICRAEDGQLFEVDATFRDIELFGSLERFLREQTGVDEENILAYLSDGHRLRTENLRELAGTQDPTIFVYNKSYLDLDIDIVLRQLRVEPALQPPVEDTLATSSTPPIRPSILSTTYLRTAHVHFDEVNRVLHALHCQQEALRIASSSLDLHVLDIQEAFDTISAAANSELDKQASLLRGLDADLEIVGRVTVHKEFLSANLRRAMELGERARTLGDYVSQVKMKQVAETCQRTHDDLKSRLQDVQDTMTKLREGTDDVRAIVHDASLLDDSDLCARKSEDLLNKIKDTAAAVEKSEPHSDKYVQDLRQLESSLRAELQRITENKNVYTEKCIRALRRISLLNNYVVQLPTTLKSLQTSFRTKTSFSHIQRLHNMLYAYGATVVEIVRRKEFAQFFYQRANSILEVMAKLSANERKRRQVYRGEVHGLLPFEAKGIDDPVPSLDFSVGGSSELPYSLHRADIDDFLHVLDDLERFARQSPYPDAIESIQEARANIEKLINKMDMLESGFDRIAERSLLSSSRFLEHRRRNTEENEQAYADLEQQISHLSNAKEGQAAAFSQERRALEEEISRLRAQLDISEAARDQQDRDLHAVRAQLESETTSRRVLERRNAELLGEADVQQRALKDALAEGTDQTKTAEILRQELARARAESEAMKALEQGNRDKIQSLLEDQANALRRLDEARGRGEDLQAQIQAARLESDEVKRALLEAGREKDRLLRAQVAEHDRIMRDHIAEADGDRAVLEHQHLELRAALEGAERQLKDAQAQCETARADAVGLREELQRVEHELREARHAERVLREDLRTGRTSQADYEQRLEESGRLAAQLLDVAVAFRQTHVKALHAIQAMTSHPTPKAGVSASMTESAIGVRRGGAVIVNHVEEPFPVDPADPAAGLDALRAFDHDQFLEAVNKVAQTIRKWQKQCKEYREKAKGKISFRNFTKGDLALFLPTRNSVTKPWAAFNVSFPHYFLKPTGHLGEQLKTREWIVARITSITEGVVDHKDASTNPYGLGDGVKYYTLEVEDWTQPASSSKRRASTKKGPLSPTQADPPTAPDALAEQPPTPGPPNADAEVEESFPSRSPAANHFGARARGNSAASAGPSSLSRLLAQAQPENSSESSGAQSQPRTPPPPPASTSPQFQPPQPSQSPPSQSPPPPPHPRSPSPTPTPPPQQQQQQQQQQPTPPPPPSPSHTAVSPTLTTPQSTTVPLPLRSGSRASRLSSSSRLSSARLPFANAVKSPATTALAPEPSLSPASASDAFSSPRGSPSDAHSASPAGSPTDGLSAVLAHQRRARPTSYQPARGAPLSPALALPAAASSSSTVGVRAGDGGAGAAGVGAGGAGLTARTRLASLASSWGVSFGRRRADPPASPVSLGPPGAAGALAGALGAGRRASLHGRASTSPSSSPGQSQS
ncbi:ATG11 domain-containing protein [Phanerochaete sordida]|uniref:Autophagy-related protein 11 n=1 Tax=Phanerochaete sordida TaxID=48140 RepID=A0A9P3L7Z0_9APHY|nr:ATG11 domain-containing protein [Phanerochaete sordida]